MKYDVVIVGAGPAGSTCAKFLAEKGFKIGLVDKSKFPRDKACGGGLPIRVLNRFRYVKDKNLIESYSYGGFVYSSSLKYKAMLQRENPLIAMVIRKKFDMGLVQLAVDSGADFIEGRNVEDIKISKGKARSILSNGAEIESEVVVGADGVRSIVAKESGLIPTRRNIGICVFQEYDMDEESIDRFFGREKMCYIHSKFQGTSGYGWVFPKRQHLNIGVGRISPSVGTSEAKTSLLDRYKDYIKTLKEYSIIPENLEIGRCKGGILPFAPLEKTYADRVIIVGDAAGFINPISGEGIYYAMSSGEIAAGAIAKALEADDTSKKFLSEYQVNWKEDFGKDIMMFLRSAKSWRRQTEKFVDLASKDEKLADITLGVLLGDISIHEYKWKLIRRYLYVYFRDKLGLAGR